MIKNIIFDFGAVLVDWNPHYVYDPYFGSKEKTDEFIANICTIAWNGEVDKGKPMAQATEERVALFPEWEKEIRMYFDRWIDMIGDAIPGMVQVIKDLKAAGYQVYGLSNWARETFRLVEHRFEAFSLLDGFIISGDVKLLKPEPAIYQNLLSRYQLKAEECLFIDDNAANIAAGEAMGIRGIRFVSEPSLRESLNSILGNMKTIISTSAAPAAIGPYSQAVMVGNTLFASGQIPINPATGTIDTDDVAEQTHQSLKNVGAILREAGMDYTNVVKTTVFIADMADFAKVNEVYSQYFTEKAPARSCVAVKALPKGALIEVEVIAAK